MIKNKHKILLIISIILIISTLFSISISLAKYVITQNIIIGNINIDNTKPEIEIIYSTREITKDNVKVKIIANEEIKNIEGWEIKENSKEITKEYKENTKEQIEICDLSGNIVIANIDINNIDKELPKIELISIENSNKEFPLYANKDHSISLNIKITDNIKIKNELNSSDISIIVGEKYINTKIKEIQYIKNNEREKEFILKLSGIEEEGILKIIIPKDKIKDYANNSNEKFEYNTKIQIDNTKPKGTFSQNKIEKGKVEAVITANEPIKKLEGWDISKDKILKKIFTNDLSYKVTIYDFANNSNEIEINIIGATNIILSYASHNSDVGWSYGYGNYDIAGAEAIKKDPKFKTESLAFNLSGNIDKDFLQGRAYVYTHWGEGKKGRCFETGKIYLHGYNPSKNKWKSLLSENSIRLNNMEYFQFGGAGINGDLSVDVDGNGMLGYDIALQYRYGISAIQLKLKDYSNYSIIYQIYIDKVGWLKTTKNEEIASYKIDKPMSAIRIALVPNSEVKSIINLWDKDIGKIL